MAKCGSAPNTINEWPLLAKRRTAGPNALFMVSGWVPNCFHLSALLVQMLLNSLKNSAGSWEAGAGGARGSQCSLFTIYNSALLPTSGQRVRRRGCRLGKNPLADWEEETALLSSKVMRHSSSGKNYFLYNSTDCVQIRALLLLLWVGGQDGLRRGSSWYVKNRNTLIKGNKYGALDGS